MKHLTIVSTIIINSVFSQLVLENSYTNEDLNLSHWYIDVAAIYNSPINNDFDFNDDGIQDIIQWDYIQSSQTDIIKIIDIVNGSTLSSINARDDFLSHLEDSLVTFANILGTPNLITYNYEYEDFYIADFENNLWVRLLDSDGNLSLPSNRNKEAILSIGDVDNDGKDEIVAYYYDNSDQKNKIGIFGDGTTTASTTPNINPSSFLLNQNYPNPFNPTTSISYQVQLSGDVTLNIYDVLGNRIKTLVNESKPVGDYQIKWDGTNQNGERLSSGQYFYQLKVGDFVSTKKMVLLK